MNPIRLLDPTVVNRIAAGEVLQRPSNAVKELLENALDANSTTISIKITRGGLDRIVISDNGSGIAKADLALACARFATSKLSTADDLEHLTTYGFRGEALASISHVARVTIQSRTSDDKCAWKAHYLDGVMVPPPIPDGSVGGIGAVQPIPCAGTPGTTIIVEDLFFNVPARRRAISNAAAEYQRTLSMVQKYAIFAAGRCAIACSNVSTTAQAGNSQISSLATQLYTTAPKSDARLTNEEAIRPQQEREKGEQQQEQEQEQSVLLLSHLQSPYQQQMVRHPVTARDVIRMLYGSAIAKELLHLSLSRSAAVDGIGERLQILHIRTLDVQFTNANFSQRHTSSTSAMPSVHMQHNVRHRVASNLRHSGDFILFMNGRLVESPFLKRAIDNVYQVLLPKHARPFVYLSLTMDPESVDANVHPTKAEVHVLEEESVFTFIASQIQQVLSSSNLSRNFQSQAATGRRSEFVDLSAPSAFKQSHTSVPAVTSSAYAPATSATFAAFSSSAISASSAALFASRNRVTEGTAGFTRSNTNKPAWASTAATASGADENDRLRPSTHIESAQEASLRKRRAAYKNPAHFVRSDSKARKLTEFFSQSSPNEEAEESSFSLSPSAPESGLDHQHHRVVVLPRSASGSIEFRLSSVRRIYEKHTLGLGHEDMARVLRDATFVGCFTEPVGNDGDDDSLTTKHGSAAKSAASFLSASADAGSSNRSRIMPSILFQHATELWMVVATPSLLTSLCAQRILRLFGRLPYVSLSVPLSVTALLQAALSSKDAVQQQLNLGSFETTTTTATESPPVDPALGARLLCQRLLLPHAAMLADYFSLQFTEIPETEGGSGTDLLLTGLPQLLSVGHTSVVSQEAVASGTGASATMRTNTEGVCIAWDLVPFFLLKLCSCVRDWSNEDTCFEDVVLLLAEFSTYCILAAHEELDGLRWNASLEHGIFPALSDGHYVPLKEHVSGNCFIPLASLERLYKVFERC